MADIITEVCLPSRGKLYSVPIVYENRLRAPRLRDRGLSDTTRTFKLQANILDKTLLEPLGMSAYDLHTADFIYLNMRQRQLARGGAPYTVTVRCGRPTCGKIHKIDVQLDELEVKPLLEKPVFEFNTSDETPRKIDYTFVTPRIIDESKDRAQAYKEQYPDVECSLDTLETQEFLRMVILSVDGQKLTYAQTTDFISNLLLEDVAKFMSELSNVDFGVQLRRTLICPDCGKEIVYDLPIG